MSRYHLQHDYEQHTLQWSLVQLRAFRSSVETLRLQAMSTALDERGWPHYPHAVWHVDHSRQALPRTARRTHARTHIHARTCTHACGVEGRE